MKTMWDAGTQREIKARVERLKPDATGRWGKMLVQQMICHLDESLKMALGELHCEPKRMPLRYPPLKQFIIYLAPFPKNAPTAPELVIAATPRPWSADVASLETQIGRFVGRGAGGHWPDHPAFGRLSGRAWGVLVYRHIDHHLRQFGG